MNKKLCLFLSVKILANVVVNDFESVTVNYLNVNTITSLKIPSVHSTQFTIISNSVIPNVS
jgi:hypothetical protein